MMSTSQLELPYFDGITYEHERDAPRLAAQTGRVKALMADGMWRTLREIAQTTGDPEASVSARLRDLRKPRFGSHVIERRYLGDGLYEYRMHQESQPS